MEPVKGAVILPGRDFTSADTWREIRAAIAGREVQAVLSDMAPNVSGNPNLDHEAITDLVYTVLKFRNDHAPFFCAILLSELLSKRKLMNE